MRVAPVKIDKRNDVQRNLDEAVRQAHNSYGDRMEGFALVVFTDDPQDFMIKHCRGGMSMDYVIGLLEDVIYALDGEECP